LLWVRWLGLGLALALTLTLTRRCGGQTWQRARWWSPRRRRHPNPNLTLKLTLNLTLTLTLTRRRRRGCATPWHAPRRRGSHAGRRRRRRRRRPRGGARSLRRRWWQRGRSWRTRGRALRTTRPTGCPTGARSRRARRAVVRPEHLGPRSRDLTSSLRATQAQRRRRPCRPVTQAQLVASSLRCALAAQPSCFHVVQ